MIDIITETLIDSIKILPFLFISYLIIEFIEHKSSQKLQKSLSTSGKYSKIVGAALGIIPQCGFSAIAANLFSNRVITMGTLIAVFLATSDEAIPIMLTYPERTKDLIIILIIKFVIAVLFGSIIDMIFKNKHTSKDTTKEMNDHIHNTCKDCDCEHGILKSSIYHTLNIFLFLIIISFAINLLIEYIGMDTFEKFILSGSIFQPFIASIIGLIPNCASSVLLTKLFIDGSISLGSIIAGLSTGAGVGSIILFKTNKNLKENFKILGLVYIIGVFCGIVIDLIIKIL